MTEQPALPDDPSDSAPQDGPVQDPEWTRRYRLRLRAAMEVLAEHNAPLAPAALQDALQDRVPLTAYDLSTTKSGAQRGWNNLYWNLVTTYQHAGWVHATTAGYRLSREGREAIAEHEDAQDLFEAGAAGYWSWDEARKEPLAPDPTDPARGIVHPGQGAAHVRRACNAVLAAWRNGDSALVPGSPIWSPESTEALSAYLRSAVQPTPGELPGLTDDNARLLAAEMLVLLVAPLSDMRASTKRARIRGPLMLANDPPGLPPQLSGDLEHGFVVGGKALIADPIAMLRSFVTILEWWWTTGELPRVTSKLEPTLMRRQIAGAPGADERVVALLQLLLDPAECTALLSDADRRRVVDAFADRLLEATGDLDQDLKAVVLSLQSEHGGSGVDLAAPPLVNVWNGSVDTGGA